jgi:hypothetical protein
MFCGSKIILVLLFFFTLRNAGHSGLTTSNVYDYDDENVFYGPARVSRSEINVRALDV